MTFSANLGSANIMATSPARTSESRLTCMAYDRDGENVLEVNGALDLSSAPSLCARIEATFGGPAGRLLIDLSGLEFCDSAGLRALFGAVQEARVHAMALRIVPPRAPEAARALEI